MECLRILCNLMAGNASAHGTAHRAMGQCKLYTINRENSEPHMNHMLDYKHVFPRTTMLINEINKLRVQVVWVL